MYVLLQKLVMYVKIPNSKSCIQTCTGGQPASVKYYTLGPTILKQYALKQKMPQNHIILKHFQKKNSISCILMLPLWTCIPLCKICTMANICLDISALVTIHNVKLSIIITHTLHLQNVSAYCPHPTLYQQQSHGQVEWIIPAPHNL